MKVIAVFDDKDYDENWSRFTRRAVRAVIIKNNRIALVKCEKEGYYKFPGGGIKNGESHLETLIRETSEETGLQIIPDSIKELERFTRLENPTIREKYLTKSHIIILLKWRRRKAMPILNNMKLILALN